MEQYRRPIARVLALVTAITAFAAIPATASGLPEHDPNHIMVGWSDSLSAAQRAAVHASLGGTVANRFDWIDVDVVRVPEGVSPIEAVRRYEADGRAAYAELNVLRPLHGTPNDTHFGSLWGLHNIGQFFGHTSDADIDAPEGWDIGYGVGQFPNTGGVRVGVIDTGIANSHEEFAGGKIKACVRATSGWGDVTNGSCEDDVDHGTHVAGTIAAHANNSKGVAGVAPASGLAIAKACMSYGCYDTDTIASLNWLRTSGGAKVINMSFGGSSSGTSFNAEVQAAYDNGVLLVASAGNGSSSTVNYPAGYAAVISVAALEGDNTHASFSNTNSDVELIAPGVSIRSTVLSNSYGYKSGTSMASPHVAGVGALVMAASGADNKTTRNLMNSTAVDLGSSGRDNYHGYGRVNLAAALASSPLKPAITSPVQNALLNTTTVTVSGTGKADAPLQVKEGSTVLASTTVGTNKTWSASVTLGQGSRTITAVSEPGTSVERASDPRTFTIDSIPPAAPAVSSPTSGQVIPSSTVSFSGTAEAASKLTLSEGGVQIASATANSSGAWSTSATLGQGSRTVSVVAKDAANNVSAATTVTFTVAAPPPGPVILTPAANEHIPNGSSVIVSGTSSNATQIKIKENNVLLTTATPGGDGSWSTVLSFANGSHTIAATAIDADGYESAATQRSFFVGPLPSAVIDTPAAGSINAAAVRISGTATAGSIVRIYEGGTLIASTLTTSAGTFSTTHTFSDGEHTIIARGEINGVPGEPTPPRSFIVDLQAPVLTLENRDPMVSLRTTDPVLTGFVEDNRGLARVTVTLARLGGSSPATFDAECADCATELASEWSALLESLPSGYHTATIRAYDKVGNVSNPRAIRIVRV